MNRTLECIIADDDDIDLLTTLSYVKKYDVLKVIGVFSNAEDVIEATKDKMPDIVFLDVDMPGLSGLELRRKLLDIPACIFITSYPDYAVESFELDALDFMVKPVKADRFNKTIDRIIDFFTTREKAELLDHTLGGNCIMIKDGHSQIKIMVHQVLYLEALKDYTNIVTAHEKHCVLTSLGNLIKEPGFDSFIRIHKSFAVQKHYIEKIKSTEVQLQNITLPVGRMYKEALSAIK